MSGHIERKETMKYTSFTRNPYGHAGWRIDLILPRADRLGFAVVDDAGEIWNLCHTRRGAVMARNHHRRNYHRAANHYARNPVIVALDTAELRSALLEYAQRHAVGDTCGAQAARAAIAGRKCKERWVNRTDYSREWGGLVEMGASE
jgi:predicted short-subunit dehydrogenase-like oxidoreductase (DUF2520 family)